MSGVTTSSLSIAWSLRNWVMLDYEEDNGLTIRPWAPFLLSSTCLPSAVTESLIIGPHILLQKVWRFYLPLDVIWFSFFFSLAFLIFHISWRADFLLMSISYFLCLVVSYLFSFLSDLTSCVSWAFIFLFQYVSIFILYLSHHFWSVSYLQSSIFYFFSIFWYLLLYYYIIHL